ncbi:alpha-hydroxy-acid oxidizing protein [Gemmatirosa kalamazoonensis]|uniref:alpha-hydroxy-acid oxidizing protein n=1 Tax=Gemmatirosa kalamazoonensis TaxID=861299 RepID=UPI00046CDB7B|nr:alpha-hydroxy-acid oxidizing protein [Gemmatirosa kalamazoonensis]
MPDATPTPKRQTDIYLAGAAGAKPRVPVDPARLEADASRAMSAAAYAYVAGGAGSEETVRANRRAFERRRLVPRVLRDVSVRDTSVELFGRRLPSPLVVSPVGVLELAHPDADLAVARAAASLGIPMVFSSQASVPMEACAGAMHTSPRWFQLYWSRDDELVESFARRAEACGCDAIVVTLDTTLLGWRPRDLELGHLPFLRGQGIAQYTSDPVFMRKLAEPLPGAAPARVRPTAAAVRTLLAMARAVPGGALRNLRTGTARAAVRRFVATYSRPSLTWADLPFLRARTRLPIVLKGILHPDDARRALDAGVDGVWVSNHGGRQVDGSIAAVDALPAIVEAVGGRAPVLMDGGVRGGADVVRALALGARAVGVGRPYVYGLALAGEAGVREVLANLVAEFELTMALAGCRSVSEIDRGCLVELH